MKKVTFAGSHGFKVGDLISVRTADTRRWRRFLHWILRLPKPTTVKVYRCTNIPSTVDIELDRP